LSAGTAAARGIPKLVPLHRDGLALREIAGPSGAATAVWLAHSLEA
jgi:hypothetical protein